MLRSLPLGAAWLKGVVLDDSRTSAGRSRSTTRPRRCRTLINPFWMLPLLGILGIRARDIVGFTFLQLVVHLPVVLFLLWLLAKTLTYVPPVIPG